MKYLWNSHGLSGCMVPEKTQSALCHPDNIFLAVDPSFLSFFAFLLVGIECAVYNRGTTIG